MTADQHPADMPEGESHGDHGVHDEHDEHDTHEVRDHAAPPPPPPTTPIPAPPTAPGAIPSDSRNWAMGAHLSAFVGAFFALAFVGPLVVWLIKKDEDGFVAHHAKEALNFNLSLLIYGIAAIVLTLVTIGIGAVVTLPLAAIAAVAWIVLTIVAAVKASNGEGYRYPLTLRLIN